MDKITEKGTVRMKTSLVAVLALSLVSLTVHAQVESPSAGRGEEFRKSIFGLGLFGGPATGLGLSFRHHLPSNVSYQIVGGVISTSSKLSYDLGIQIQYDLMRSMRTRFYAGGGIAYFYSGKSGGGNTLDGPGRLGIGIGGEFITDSEFSATLELMFTYFTDGTILPLPQVGVHYYF
jgi:hypothetical protein